MTRQIQKHVGQPVAQRFSENTPVIPGHAIDITIEKALDDGGNVEVALIREDQFAQDRMSFSQFGAEIG